MCALLLIVFAMALYLHLRAQAQIRRLKAQGMQSLPDNERFFFGSVGMVAKYFNLIRTDDKERVYPQISRWFADSIEKEERKFNSKKHPMVITNHFAKVVTMVSDPEVMSDLYNKQNKKVEKVEESARMFGDLLGSSLLFGPSDEDWRRKRKACAHAFYKDRLQHMIEVLKKQVG